MILKIDVVKEVREIITLSQKSKVLHHKLMKRLMTIYEKSNEGEFATAFIDCLCVPFAIIDKYPSVFNIMTFTAKFSSSLLANMNEEDNEAEPEELCEFLSRLIDFLITSSNATDLAVQYRVCEFLNLFLNSMGEHAFLDDEICDKFVKCLTDCAMSKSLRIRTQALLALQRLQEPANDQCNIIKLYIFHLAKDPSAEVRKAAVNCLGRNGKGLKAAILSTRDVNDGVRKSAYIYISKIRIRALSIKMRLDLLRDGLDDKSLSVQKVVKETLIPTWLQHLDGNYMEFIRALNGEITTEIVCQALEILFDRTERRVLFEQIPLDPNTKLIPLTKVTSEVVLYWRCFIEYLHKRDCVELLEECIPELSKFCDYIRDFQTQIATQETPLWDDISQKFILCELFTIAKSFDLSDEAGRKNLEQLILDTLLGDKTNESLIKLIVHYSEKVMPDVQTRLSNLAHVISEIRMPTRQSTIEVQQMTDEERHECQMKIQRLKMNLIPIQDELYNAMQKRNLAQAQKLQENVKEIEETIKTLSMNLVIPEAEKPCEEKNDPETILKCLQIMCAMMEVKSVTTFTATLRSLFDNMVLPMLVNSQHNQKVQALALQAAGICMLLDKDLAKEHWAIYLYQFTGDDRDCFIVSLKIVFDLFLKYGLDFFEVAHDHNEETQNNITHNESRRNRTGRTLYNNTDNESTAFSIANESRNNKDVVKIMLTLLDHGDQEVRTIATEGFCKLMIHGKLSSVHLLSRLIILLYNPVTENDVNLRASLLTFFKIYISSRDNLDILAQAFLPTLHTVDNAPEESPLQAVDPLNTAMFILDSTNSRIFNQDTKNCSIHNDLAFTILAEILTPKYNIDQEVLIKSLKFLNIYCDSDEIKRDMKEAVKRISDTVTDEDKNLRLCLIQFVKKIDINSVREPAGEEQHENNLQNVENLENAQNQEEDAEDRDIFSDNDDDDDEDKN